MKQPYGMSDETRRQLEAIARKHRFRFTQLQKPGRGSKALCAARRECYLYLWTERRWSTPQIGALFNRDHTTVVWWLDNKGRRAVANERRVA